MTTAEANVTDSEKAAREAVASYDSPRCDAVLTVEGPDGPHEYRCCLPAGHREVAPRPCDFGPRSTAVSVNHLRWALGKIDILRAELRLRGGR